MSHFPRHAPPRSDSRRAAWPALLPPHTREQPRPPPPRTERAPVLLHTAGKVPGSRGGVWGACDAQACLHTSASSHDSGLRRGARSAGRSPPGPSGGRARTYARRHAHRPGAAGSPATKRTVTWSRRGKPRESDPPGA